MLGYYWPDESHHVSLLLQVPKCFAVDQNQTQNIHKLNHYKQNKIFVFKENKYSTSYIRLASYYSENIEIQSRVLPVGPRQQWKRVENMHVCTHLHRRLMKSWAFFNILWRFSFCSNFRSLIHTHISTKQTYISVLSCICNLFLLTLFYSSVSQPVGNDSLLKGVVTRL